MDPKSNKNIQKDQFANSNSNEASGYPSFISRIVIKAKFDDKQQVRHNYKKENIDLLEKTVLLFLPQLYLQVPDSVWANNLRPKKEEEKE